MTMPDLVKKLELSPKLLSFPASGEVNWELHVPIQKMYEIRGELESADAFARWHYREVELSKKQGVDDADGDFESHRVFINEAATLGSVEDTYAELRLPEDERWYYIYFGNNNDSEACGFLIRTGTVRKEVE